VKEELSKALELEIALKVVQTLPEKQKEKIIAEAVLDRMQRLQIGYEVSKVLEGEAMKFVHEYVKTPEVQLKLRTQACKAVDNVIDGIVKGLEKEFEGFIKSQYRRFIDK